MKYDGILRAFKLKPDHVPTVLQGEMDAIPKAKCSGYPKGCPDILSNPKKFQRKSSDTKDSNRKSGPNLG